MTAATSTAIRRDLRAFFSPRSVALVGASEKSAWSHGVAAKFRAYGYTGHVFAVNRGGLDAHGYPGFKSCKDIPGKVDFAYLFVPAEATFEALTDAADAGIKHVSILTSGFAEIGEAGARLQEQLVDFANARGITLQGPNSLGFANIAERLVATSIPTRTPLIDGSVGLVSQSGAVVSEISKVMHQQGVGLRFVAATGNEAQIALTDVIDYLVDDPGTRVIAVFSESIRDPQSFREVALRALAARKPIVILKVGKSEISAQVAKAHTGALVGDDRVFDAVCAQYGVVRVDSIEELVATSDLLSRVPPLKTGGVGVVSISGGACGMFADRAAEYGVSIPPFSDATREALRQVLPEFASDLNPLDITGAVIRTPELWEAALPIVAGDENVGLVVVLNQLPGTPEELRGLRENVLATGRGLTLCRTPGIVASLTAQPMTETMRQVATEAGLSGIGAGIPLTVRAIAGHVRWSECLARFERGEHRARSADEARPHGGERPCSEREVLEYLRKYDVPVIPAHVAQSAEEAVRFARSAGGPVALKILSADITHKSDIGGVRLGIAGDDAVARAYIEIHEAVRNNCPHARIDGIVVSPMRGVGIEMFVGTARDPHWGPVIAVGLGGLWVEVLADTAVRPLPVTPADVKEMLGSLRAAKILQGFRGTQATDLDALAQTIVRIGDAALALGPQLASLEINPLLVSGNRNEALDGLCVWEKMRG